MFRTEEVIVGDVRLAYGVRGRHDSPKMVLLHALGERGASWVDIADRFATSFEVFTPDLRGHGESSRAAVYSFESMFDDVTGLLDHLGLRSVVLVGHSMGGVVAYLIAQRRPDLVERLIVEDVTPPFRQDRPPPQRPSEPESLPFDWSVVPAIVAEVDAGDAEMWTQLISIAAPTLLICGGPDSHIPQGKLLEVSSHIPNCQLVTIAAGHHIHASQPDEFVKVVADWIPKPHR